MFIRPIYIKSKGKRLAYWALVESYRTEKGPRQRIVAYEVFAGNTHDSKTYQKIIRKMEAKYGKANRVWCSDRGMMSKENIEFLKQENRRFIIGTAKAELRKFEQELLAEDWNIVREGLEVKLTVATGNRF